MGCAAILILSIVSVSDAMLVLLIKARGEGFQSPPSNRAEDGGGNGGLHKLIPITYKPFFPHDLLTQPLWSLEHKFTPLEARTLLGCDCCIVQQVLSPKAKLSSKVVL